MKSSRPTITPPEGTVGMPDSYYRVAKVIDATTLDVWDDKGLVRVWLAGVQSPEIDTPMYHLGKKVLRNNLQVGGPVYLKVLDFNFKWRRAIAEATAEGNKPVKDLLLKVGFKPYKNSA